ncbi:hypothetical protein NPIL_480501 [Nephila pilipes]|uniref:Uncharacterized protein n=1 Tax=Nephila pilipes TaxID=299642 RepID=A0A8X6T918_NEPPI|nr:hypothetical protein NPIL_480501 [Nephila pilipes]
MIATFWVARLRSSSGMFQRHHLRRGVLLPTALKIESSYRVALSVRDKRPGECNFSFGDLAALPPERDVVGGSRFINSAFSQGMSSDRCRSSDGMGVEHSMFKETLIDGCLSGGSIFLLIREHIVVGGGEHDLWLAFKLHPVQYSSGFSKSTAGKIEFVLWGGLYSK